MPPKSNIKNKFKVRTRSEKATNEVFEHVSKKIDDPNKLKALKNLCEKSPYSSLNIYWQIFLATFGGILIWFAIFFFITPTNIFVGGVTGIAIIIVGIDENLLRPYFYIFLTILHVPFIILGFRKIGKRFTALTVYIIIIQLIVGTILSFLPQITQQPDIINNLINAVFNINGANGLIDESRRIISAIVGSLIFSVGVGLCFIGGLCSGGTDFLNTYLSVKKQKSVGYSLFLVNGAIIVLGFFIVIPLQIANGQNPNIDPNDVTAYIFAIGIPTAIYLATFSLVLDLVFPINKKISLNIVTKRKDYIIEMIKKTGFNRSFTVIETQGAYSKNNIINVVTRYREARFLIKFIGLVDEDAFITATTVKFLHGKFKAWKAE